MTRLVNDTRYAIRNALVAHRFAGTVERMNLERGLLAQDLYEAKYKIGVRNKIGELPDGWLPERERISAHFGGSKHTFEFNGDFNPVSGENYYAFIAAYPSKENGLSRRILNKDQSDFSVMINHDSPLFARVEKAEQDYKQLALDWKSAGHEVMGTLNKFSSVEKLIEAWPEIEPFVPEGKKAVNLPAVPVKDLNAAFKLPVAA